MPTVNELGQKVKAKYPGVYDDLPDDELGRKVKAKYPGSYDDFADSGPQPQGKLDPLDYVGFPIGSPMSVPASKAIDAFPTMGGIVGGVALGYPGAAAYGGSMEMLRRSLRGMPLDPKASALEGAKQGLMQLAGAGLSAGTVLASKGVPAVARGVESALGSPLMKGIGRMGRFGLPIGGAMRGGIPGMVAGMALPAAGKAALKVALSPKTEAVLSSMAFRSLARHFPQVAAQLSQQLIMSDQANAQAQ